MPYPKPATIQRVVLTAFCGSLLLPQNSFSAVALPAALTPAAECRIRVSDNPAGLRLEAIADAKAAVAGHYKLSVIKESTSGSSQNTESGEFHADGAHEQILATVMLDRSAIGHYRATLSLDWNDGNVTCSSP